MRFSLSLSLLRSAPSHYSSVDFSVFLMLLLYFIISMLSFEKKIQLQPNIDLFEGGVDDDDNNNNNNKI